MKKFITLVLAMSLLWGMAGAEKLNYERLFNGDQKVQGFWMADDANLEFGDDLDMTMLYDETTNDRFELTMTSGGMYFDVTDITFYTDDATNESLTFTGFVPAFGAGIAIPDDMSATFGDDSDATITYDETTDNELEITCSNGISVESATTFDSTVGISDDLTMAANKDITMSGTAVLTGVTGTYSGTVQGEQITSTDDALIYDDVTCNDIIVNATVDIDGNVDVDGNTDLDLLNVSESATFNEAIIVDKEIGTAPFTITSTTVVANLNVDQVDGKDSTDFVLLDGTQELTADWDAGDYEITADDLTSDNDTTVGGALDVDGATTLDGLTVAEAATFSSTIDVDGASTLDTTTVSEAMIFHATRDSSASYTVLATDYYVLLNYTDTGTVSVTIPTSLLTDGRTLHFKDEQLNASGYAITIATEGAEQIDESDTATISSDGGSLSLFSDGTSWFAF